MASVGPPRELSQRISDDPTSIILSYRIFTIWWLIIITVHTITCIYNALYAYCYWKLHDTSLNLYLEFYKIGMPQQYHHTIALIYAALSTIHGVCVLLMLGSSIWMCSLTFSPWSSCKAGTSSDEAKPGPRLTFLVKIYNKFTYPCGLFGVRGNYFELALVCREIVETTLQTIQAYRMSALLPRTLLNRFYSILLGVNCWSSVIIDTVFTKRDEARRRFASVFFDCLLDLMATMGVEFIVLLSYLDDFDPGIKGFNELIWYSDEWVARALNEFQIVFVVSWSDLVIRAIFSLGLVVTTTSMKKLLRYHPRNRGQIAQAVTNVVAIQSAQFKDRLEETTTIMPLPQKPHQNHPIRQVKTSCLQGKSVLLKVAHFFFVIWGTVVFGLHIHASMQPTLLQCLTQVRPWMVSKPSCYLAGLDCHALGISGKKHEVESVWSEFDSSTVVQLLIRHCFALEVPNTVADFHKLRGIKVYNSTIVNWSQSAAISSIDHPQVTYLYIVRVNFTDGLLPAGLQSPKFPNTINDIEMCVTNLQSLPDDLDTKWAMGAIIQIEYSQLIALPLSLIRLKPLFLFLTGNPLTELPPETFEVEGLMYLGISDNNLRELPKNVTHVSPSLSLIEIGNSDISYFWSWVDELVGRADNPAFILAEDSTYCEELKNIQNGTITSFGIPLSPDYSRILMNTSTSNWEAIARIVDCDFVDTPYYPLVYEDEINAISAPPPLVRQR